MKAKNISLIYILCALITAGILYSEEKYRWRSVAGKWRAQKEGNVSYMVETKLKTRKWGYSELVNYNSIITNDILAGTSSIKFNFRFQEPVNSQVEAMAFFSALEYRDFFAFRFSGSEKSFTTIQATSSKIKDQAKPNSVKWNYTITESEPAECALEYNRDYEMEIKIAGKKAALYLEGKKIIESCGDRELSDGGIGFSVRGAALRLNEVTAFKGKEIIFKDDFSEDRVKRIIVEGKIEQVDK